MTQSYCDLFFTSLFLMSSPNAANIVPTSRSRSRWVKPVKPKLPTRVGSVIFNHLNASFLRCFSEHSPSSPPLLTSWIELLRHSLLFFTNADLLASPQKLNERRPPLHTQGGAPLVLRFHHPISGEWLRSNLLILGSCPGSDKVFLEQRDHRHCH
jgi:hypothetical protein